MSTHPNVLLILKLTPDGLARKTYREILSYSEIEDDEIDDIEIGKHKYHHMVMEGDYDESYQISADEGDIVVFDLVTYGYGESVGFGDLLSRRHDVEEWAKVVCKKFNCNFSICVSANYW